MKNDMATQKSNVLISIVHESYVERRVKTCRLTLAKLYLTIEATKRLKLKTHIVLIARKRNLNFVIDF